MICFADFNGLPYLGRYLSNAGAGNLNRYVRYNAHTVYFIQNFLLFSEVFLSVSWNTFFVFSSCKLSFWRIFFLFGGYLLSWSWFWKILHMPNKDKKQFCNSMYKLNTQKYCFSAYASYRSNGITFNPVNIGYFSHLWVIW